LKDGVQGHLPPAGERLEGLCELRPDHDLLFLVAFRLRDVAGRVDRQRDWRGHSTERTAPEGFRGVPVLPPQPRDRSLIGWCSSKGARLAADEGLVAPENLVEDQRQAPAVEEDVVQRPDHPVQVQGEPDEGHPPHGRRPEIEPALPVASQEGLELLLLLGGHQGVPIVLLEGHVGLPPHDLQRLLEALPRERRAEYRVPRGRLPPRGAIRGLVERALEQLGHLHEVGDRLGGKPCVEEHPLLHGGKRVDGLDALLRPEEAVEA
jgi:hypothetical protein